MTKEQKDKIIKILDGMNEKIKEIKEYIDIPNVSNPLTCANMDIITAIDLIKKDGKKWGEE